MKLIIVLAAALVVIARLAGHGEEIKGEVFIVTKGGDNKRLGRVDVAAFESAPALKHLTEKGEAAKTLIPRLKAQEDREDAEAKTFSVLDSSHRKHFDQMIDWLCVRNFYRSGRYYMQGMPAPVAAAKTDSDGRYGLIVTPGDYVVAATAERSTGKDGETYYWVLPVKVSEGKITALTLSNDNMASAKGADSLIYTLAPGGEADDAVKGEKLEQAMLAKLDILERPPAAPTPPQQTPKSVAEAQSMAIAKYPDLGVAGSALNAAFVAEVQRMKRESPGAFGHPDWPLWLAQKCSEKIAGK